MSKAKPLLYADRAERYLRQRGIPYDPEALSVHLLTPRQRHRALKKENRAIRRLAEETRALADEIRAAQ